MRVLLLLAAIVFSGPLHAQELKFVTWNINGGEKTDLALANNAEALRDELGGFDVLILQEVISQDQVSAIAERLAMEYWAISDFSPPVSITGKWFRSLEVAIVSSVPFDRVAEWDTTGNEPNGDGFIPRVSSEEIASEEVAVDIEMDEELRPSRGFLRANFDNGVSVYAVHWKSSSGESCNAADIENAGKRENNARGVAHDAEKELSAGRTVMIAGDYNIQAIGRTLRSGTDQLDDCEPTSGTCEGICGDGGKDGYDDAVSIITDLGNEFRLLSQNVPFTYVSGSFGGYAIDHIAVAGPQASEFSAAVTVEVDGDTYLGSDHRPVIASLGAEIGVGDMLATPTLDDLGARALSEHTVIGSELEQGLAMSRVAIERPQMANERIELRATEMAADGEGLETADQIAGRICANVNSSEDPDLFIICEIWWSAQRQN